MKLSTSILAASAITSVLVLASASFVQAAPPPFFPSFQFGINVGPGDNFDNGDHPHRQARDCLSDQDIADELRGQGYRHLEEVDQTRHTLTFDASLGRRTYELKVDGCSGEILSSTRLHP